MVFPPFFDKKVFLRKSKLHLPSCSLYRLSDAVYGRSSLFSENPGVARDAQRATVLCLNLYLSLILEEILQSLNRIGYVLSGDRSAHFENFIHETE